MANVKINTKPTASDCAYVYAENQSGELVRVPKSKFAGSSSDSGSSGGSAIAITNVSESNADGGSNVVTFSDGTRLTIKNGNRGSDASVTGASVKNALGYTPANQETVAQLSNKIAELVNGNEVAY